MAWSPTTRVSRILRRRDTSGAALLLAALVLWFDPVRAARADGLDAGLYDWHGVVAVAAGADVPAFVHLDGGGWLLSEDGARTLLVNCGAVPDAGAPAPAESGCGALIVPVGAFVLGAATAAYLIKK